MSLTPIHESEEEGQNLSVNTDSCIEEHNNSSVIPKHVSESVCGSVSADKESSSKEKKVVIESCSGRKIEDVEVLKQKYINSQIQDLPRVIRGPFGQDRIWRTRRRSLNLGSQDIRNQLSKISLKMDGDMKLDYRCKKYTDPSDKALGIKKSVEEILYGNSYNPDDYDPELAALFENYIEECDNVTKKHFSANPTTCAANNEETIFKNQDAEHAFLCGFIEGMKRTDGSLEELEQENPVHGNELIDDSVMKSESFKELVSVKESASLKELDSVKKSASFNELISSQQDITHMSLREWEDVQRAEEHQKENNRRQLIKKCLACKNKKPREIKNISDNMKSVPTVEGDWKAMKRIKAMKKRVENVTDDERHNVVIKEDDDDSYIVKGSVVKETLSCHHCCKYLKPNLERTTLSPSMGEKSVLKNKHRVADLNNLSKEDDSMIKLAKQKLEHSLLTTRALEETYLSMAKAKKIINDCKPAGHWKDRNESNENKTSISNVEAKGIHTGTIILDELEGWKTKNKAFIDQESVQVSSSELLHPVESSEMLGSPLWTPASSASHFKSTPEINRAMSPAHTREHTLPLTKKTKSLEPLFKGEKAINQGKWACKVTTRKLLNWSSSASPNLVIQLPINHSRMFLFPNVSTTT
ncbi:uncharacterized protein LOC123531637 isoform X2 [Mercenaria mercenaria]|uniref:uncharacterized protein LOC123531637 isoform X2 n=1 Tax=Mercenaria mercenaria TaxID=6596 RepID=UPI00234E8141|nr:uncharacterized protein LOC123531637 isoform X2 [Mercenaria mercenaria]